MVLKKFKRWMSLTMAAALCLSCMAPLAYALEPEDTVSGTQMEEPVGEENTATPESGERDSGLEASTADAFVAAVETLDRDTILAAANAWGLANRAWQADPENEERNTALEQAIVAQDEATAPLYAAENLYYDLTEEERQQAPVVDAYAALTALYAAMTAAMENPVDPDTQPDPPEDALAVLYSDLPDAPTGSYMGNMGLPIATGETKISISEWREDLFTDHTAYMDADVLDADGLALTVGKQDGADYAIVPILVQVEYPANGSSAAVELPAGVEVASFTSDDTERSKALNYSYSETSASVSGFYVKAAADFDAVFHYSAPDGTTLSKTLHITVAEDAALVPSLFAARNNTATYTDRPTPSVTSGKITKVERVADTWLIWFNGQPAYCCSHGLQGQPAGCPTYSYSHTSTVDADQFIPGDHYGNQIRIWGGLGQLSLGLLTARHEDTEATADTTALKYAYSVYDDDQLFVIEHYPQSQTARLYMESAKAAMGQATSHTTTYDGNGYYTYIYDSGNPNWQIVALEGPPIEGDTPPDVPEPAQYYASWEAPAQSASGAFNLTYTLELDKYQLETLEKVAGAKIEIEPLEKGGSIEVGTWAITPADKQTITTGGHTMDESYQSNGGAGSASWLLHYSVSKSSGSGMSGQVGPYDSQAAADQAADAARNAAVSQLQGQAQAAVDAAIATARNQLAVLQFTVNETVVPYGFGETDSSCQQVGVSADAAKTVKIANDEWSLKVRIRKTDSETGNQIAANAEFDIFEWDTVKQRYIPAGGYNQYAVVRQTDGTYAVINHSAYADGNDWLYYTQRNEGKFLIVEQRAPAGYYGDWTDVSAPGTAGSVLGKRAYAIEIKKTNDGNTIWLSNADYNADILTENRGGILVETPEGIVTVEISDTAKPAGRTYITDTSGLAANEDTYTMLPQDGAFQNDHAWGELVLTKEDLDQAGGTAPHGDAAIEGAVYDLYAAEDIHHPDGVSGVVDYSKITDGSGSPLHHTTVLTNGGWDSNYLPVLKKDHLVASAAIKNGKLAFANLYLGKYYLVERATGLVLPLDENGQYYVSGQYPVLNSKLEPTGKYKALAQSGGEYTDYVYQNQYSTIAESRALDGSKTYDGYYLSYATGYLCDEVNHYQNLTYGGESRYITRSEDSSPDAVLKSGFEIRKLVSTTGQPSPALKLQGAGFTVYRVSALSKVSEFTLNPDGTCNAQSILDAYRKDAYDNETAKYDFSGEGHAVAAMYESDAATVERYNRTLTPDGDNANGSGKGWVPTDKPNNYRLAEIFTNEEGILRVQGLPYGQYLVVETTTPKDVFQADPFMVSVNSAAPQSVFCTPNGAVTKPSNSYMTYNVLDEELEGYLQLIKMDAETGKAVKIANTAFSIYALHENGKEELVEMTDPASGNAWAKTSVFYTDENGELKTPEKLPLGRYRIVEIEGPEGFYNDRQYNVVFELTSERVWQVDGNSTDDMDLYVITETYSNHETLGQLTIRKEGDVLTGYEDGKFLYTKDSLAGAVYGIRAKGNVATGDCQDTLWYADGDLVATVTTGEDGQIDETEFAPTRTAATYNFLSVSHDGSKGEVTITLPLGCYEIQEIKAPYGFTLSDTVYEATLEWADQTNDIVLAKTITVDGKTQEYGIVNTKDATVEEVEARKLMFMNERVVPVPDKPGKIGVGIYKQDRDTEISLAGACYDLYTVDAIYDLDGNKLAEAGALLGSSGPTDASGFAWFPVDIPIQGQLYANGVTGPENGVWTAAYNSGNYRIVEKVAPKGYLLDNTPVEVSFAYPGQLVSYQVINGTNANQPTSFTVSKLDLTNGEELPGATLTVTDAEGSTVREWVSLDTPYPVRGLELEKEYILTETKPVPGYALAESIVFKLAQPVDENGVALQETEVYIKDGDGNWNRLDDATVVMEDDITKVKISKTDIVTGEELPGAELVIKDESGKEVERWTSTNEPHTIEKLPAGRYTLTERTAPDGYMTAEEVPFEVLPTGEIQTVVMKDAPALRIRKTAAGGKDLPGATLVIRNLAGGEIARWVTDGGAHEVPVTGWEETLPGGLLLSTADTEHVYELYETVAPDGYVLAGRIYFKVERSTDGMMLVYTRPDRDSSWTLADGSTLTMVDERKPGPGPTPAPTPTPEITPAQPSFPRTGDHWPLNLLLGIAGVSLALVALLIYLRRRSDRSDDPADDPSYEPTGRDGE